MGKLLYEVSIIRPLVIGLMVLYHSFCIWGGEWSEFQCFRANDFYYYLVAFIKGFRIETIAFIAGYVYSYQLIDLNRNSCFLPFLKKKFNRLVVPCLFFSIIYYFIFYSKSDFNFIDFVYRVTNGAGHLWFLPMLFWCFLAMWYIGKYSPNQRSTFIILSLVSIIPVPQLPFGLTKCFHFLFYFYAGYLMWIYKEKLFAKIGKIKHIILFILIYIFLIFLNEYIKNINFSSGVFHRLIKMELLSVLKYLMTIFGILSLYLFVYSYTRRFDFKCSNFTIHLSEVCYGVYVFHQFILVYLYYHTSLPCLLGLITPWIFFTLTLFVSYLLTIIFLRFDFGKKMIG
ncbi:MAG: acyltransferase [Lentimicrobiaceae bacterium]|nr:acyltransferase [Lentimicrobiaceae bacterium]